MAQQLINLGTTANDGTGDTARAAGAKLNSMFGELYPLTRARNRRFMTLGDSRLNLGMPRWDQDGSVTKDRGPTNMGIQFWATLLSKGGITFEEADTFAVSSSPSRSFAGAVLPSVNAMGMVDYQLPLALAQSTAGNALIITSTNERGAGGGTWSGAQSAQNIIDTATALAAKGVHVYIISEYPKGTPGYSVTGIDFGVAAATYTSGGSGYVNGEIITLTHAGVTPAGGKYPKVKVTYGGGSAFSVTVVEPGSYSASNSAGLTNWTQLATTGSGSGAVFTIVEGPGAGQLAATLVHDTLNALQLPNVFIVDVWSDLAVDRDSLNFNPLLTADGVHANTSAAYIVGKALWDRAQPNLPPPPKARAARGRYDQLLNPTGNLLPLGTELSGVISGTAAAYNAQTAAAASPAYTVTGNVPSPGLIAGAGTQLIAATGLAVTMARATDDDSWFETRLTGTSTGSGGFGGYYRYFLGGSNISAYNAQSVYGKCNAGDNIRSTVECRIKRGSVGLTGVRLSISEIRATSAGYYAEHAGYPGAGGQAAGNGAYSIPWDALLAGTGYLEGLLRTGILPIVGGQSLNLICLQIDVNSNTAFDVTVGFRNWTIFKEV